MEQVKKDQKIVLFVSSLTEFGERYSYYIIQSLLIFFLIKNFGLSQAKSSALVGTVLGLVYISAIVGGYIADKLIGYYRSAFLGVLLSLAGIGILSISKDKNLLFLGLTFISISTGLIKSNMSSFLGAFYDKAKVSQSHRDFGFNIFYIGINLGSLFALFFASLLQEKYGFAMPFYSSIVITLLIVINMLFGFFRLNKYIITKTISIQNNFAYSSLYFSIYGGGICCIRKS